MSHMQFRLTFVVDEIDINKTKIRQPDRLKLEIGREFFGVRDEWNVPRSGLAFNTRKEVMDFLSGFKKIEFLEEEKKRETVSGATKHWHIFNFIAKKVK